MVDIRGLSEEHTGLLGLRNSEEASVAGTKSIRGSVQGR